MDLLKDEVIEFIVELGVKKDISEEFILLGEKSQIKSRDLVEILLIVEEP